MYVPPMLRTHARNFYVKQHVLFGYLLDSGFAPRHRSQSNIFASIFSFLQCNYGASHVPFDVWFGTFAASGKDMKRIWGDKYTPTEVH